MILWMLAFAMSVATGWFLARALTAGAFQGPRWASFLTELSLAALFGPGLASILWFALVLTGAANQVAVFAGLGALLSLSALLWWKLAPSASVATLPAKRFPWTWVLLICTAVGIIFLVLDFQAASSANPQGEWDAMSIWNLRARFLASGGDLWRRAISSETGGGMAGSAHPGYPLFLSAFVALNWVAAGTPINGWDTALPAAVSLFIALGIVVLVAASVSSRKSVALGMLACLILLTSEVFASQTAAQYSDLLQGLAFLAGLVLLDAAGEEGSSRVLVAVGLAAGLSPWIKNEGLPFAIAALALALWKFRARALPWLALGALPGFAAVAALKSLSKGTDAVLPRDVHAVIVKIAQPERWWQALLGFGKAIYDAGGAITHPVLLAILLAFALRLVPANERRKHAWLWIPIGVTAAAEYSLYLVTEANLDWHISTSVSRLVAQLWPSVIWMFVWTLRPPEELIAVAPTPAPRQPTKKRARA